MPSNSTPVTVKMLEVMYTSANSALFNPFTAGG